MDKTLEGIQHPHRFVMDDAQLHIYFLMKKVRTLIMDLESYTMKANGLCNAFKIYVICLVLDARMDVTVYFWA